MKQPIPTMLRKRAVVRVAASDPAAALSGPAYALAFVDLRFDDGHVERWLGPGSLRNDPDQEPLSSLCDWGRETIEEHQDSLLGDLGRAFQGAHRGLLTDLPVEIVVEWNARLPRF